MSDVSEHDSDSDTELQKNTTVGHVGHKVNDEVYQQSTSGVVTSTDGTDKVEDTNIVEDTSIVEDTDIVEELKRQAAATTVHEAEDTRSEWEKYMHQNEATGAYTYTDPTDGTVYEWDESKRGWIPKIDDDFIAMYQANYGFTASGEHDPNVNVQPPAEVSKEEEEAKLKEELLKAKDATTLGGKKRKQEEKKEWFQIDNTTNNNIYVSGLPTSMNAEDFIALMSRCGIIMEDDAGKPKIKMYKSANGEFKGDARCCYLKHESVALACDLLDDYDVDGNVIHVEQAVFELKGKYNPTLKPKKKKKKKPGKGQDKLLDWVDRPKKRSKYDRIVILKSIFDHKAFEKDPSLITDLKNDLRSECEKYGDIKKVIVFDRNPLGVASILFQEPDFADKCIEGLNGRYYGGQVISAETYDGVTRYEVQETEEELEKRLKEWEKFIGDDNEEEKKSTATEPTRINTVTGVTNTVAEEKTTTVMEQKVVANEKNESKSDNEKNESNSDTASSSKILNNETIGNR